MNSRKQRSSSYAVGDIVRSSGGTEIFRIQKSLLSIAPGEVVLRPFQIGLKEYSYFHVHYLINASVDVNISWRSNVSGEIGLEKTIAIPATVGNIGGIISSSSKSHFLSITFTNTDIIPLTDIYVSVFGVI